MLMAKLKENPKRRNAGEYCKSHLNMIHVVDKDMERAIQRVEKKINALRQEALDILQSLEVASFEFNTPLSISLKKNWKIIRKRQQILAETPHKKSILFLRRYLSYLKSISKLETMGK
jgi:hypothetical protein